MTWMENSPAALGMALLMLRWWILGVCWRWFWRLREDPARPVWAGLCHLMQALWLGFLFSHLLTTALLFAGLYGAGAEWWSWAALCLLGVLAGRQRSRISVGAVEWTGLAAVAATAFALAITPGRSEWMAGGWDPGVYTQQGISLSQTGAWRTPPDAVWSQLTDEEIARFTTRAYEAYTEVFPGTPLHPEQKSLERFFFPLTPVVIAQFHRAGGVAAAVRTHDLMGLLGALGWAVAVWRMTRRPYAALAAGLVLLSHPLWTYHLHIPTSEIMHVFILGALAFALADSVRSAGVQWWVAGFLFSACLNRVSFLPFGALIILLDAVRRPAARGRAWWGFALLLSAGIDALALPLTMQRLGVSHWTDSMPLLGIFGALALCLSGAATVVFRKFPRAHDVIMRYMGWGLAGAIIVAVAVFTVLARNYKQYGIMLNVMGWNTGVLWNYAGHIFLVIAIAGLLAGLLNQKSSRRSWQFWLLFLFMAAVATLILPSIARLAPWASRRQVEYALPLLTLGIVQWFLLLETRAGGRPWRKAIPVLVALAVAAQLPGAWRAWRATEYAGMDRTFKALAAQIAPADIVVADHFKWAAPLRQIYGRDAISGLVWCEKEKPRPDDFAFALERLETMARARGGHLRILTSTENRLSVFPVALPPLPLVWESPSWHVQEVNHSVRGRTIETRAKDKIFRLYTWPAEASGPPTPHQETSSADLGSARKN